MNNWGQSLKHMQIRKTYGIFYYVIINRGNQHINILCEMIKSVILFYICSVLFFP